MNPENGDKFKIIVTVSVARDGEEVGTAMPGSLPVFLFQVDAQRQQKEIKFSGVEVKEQFHPPAFDRIAKHVLGNIIPEIIDVRSQPHHGKLDA